MEQYERCSFSPGIFGFPPLSYFVGSPWLPRVRLLDRFLDTEFAKIDDDGARARGADARHRDCHREAAERCGRTTPAAGVQSSEPRGPF